MTTVLWVTAIATQPFRMCRLCGALLTDTAHRCGVGMVITHCVIVAKPLPVPGATCRITSKEVDSPCPPATLW